MEKQKSKGHICFWRSEEFFEVGRHVRRADLKHGFDPDGYRLGSFDVPDARRETVIKAFQDAIDNSPDGHYYRTCVHPEDECIFRYPTPEANYLELWRLIQDMGRQSPPFVSIKDGRVRITTQDEKFARRLAAKLEGVSGHDLDINGYFNIHTISFHYLAVDAALAIMRGEAP